MLKNIILTFIGLFAVMQSQTAYSTIVPVGSMTADLITSEPSIYKIEKPSLDTNKIRQKEINCLALGIYYESRGESLRGQQAVASVIMNRVRSSRFPNTVCGVIYQKGQFSFINGRKLSPNGGSWENALKLANQYYDKKNGDIPHLYFASNSNKGMRIGNHTFRM